MRWLLVLFVAFTLMACEEESVKCKGIDLTEFTKEEVLLLSQACGTRKVEKTLSLHEQIAVAAQQMRMTPEQFVRTDYGRALLWRDYEQRMADRVSFAIMVVVVWLTVAVTSFMIMRRPKTVDWVKGRFFWRRRVREYYEVRTNDSGENWSVFGFAVIATVLTAVGWSTLA